MTIINIAIILIIIMFALVGMKKGIIKEVVSLVGLILMFIIAYTFKEPLGNTFCKWLPFFNFSGSIEGLTSLNILIYHLIAFFIIFSVLFIAYQIILKVSGLIQKLVNCTIILAIPSKIGGLLVGLLEGYLMVYIILIVTLIPLKNIPEISESNLINTIVSKTPIISSYTSDISKTISDTYNLVEDLENENISINDANLKIIDSMIKYKVVSPKTISQLQILDKLNNVKGLDKILKENNYETYQ